MYLYEIKGFFSHKQEETRKERKRVWTTAVNNTRKMTHFMPHPLRVSAPSAGYAAPAPRSPDTWVDRGTGQGKMLRKHEAGQTISLEAVQACALIRVIKNN
ncbi:hypothetical protein [Acetobacter cerevisiae]|uniref:hypothetical protein n=1 Tax=Acetobacter cerevisiae TaxID=178900 RepID=UPI001428948E|nr:hypothetical protein [Acetobacter cerevisiae]